MTNLRAVTEMSGLTQRLTGACAAYNALGVRYALYGSLATEAHRNRPGTARDIDILVGDANDLEKMRALATGADLRLATSAGHTAALESVLYDESLGVRVPLVTGEALARLSSTRA